MDLYAENILEHHRNPRGKQMLTSPTVSHEEVNLSCGDSLMLHVVIESGHVKELGWEGSGCAISQAAMSLLSEELKGKSIAELEAIDTDCIRSLLGVPVSARRAKCAYLCLHVLKNLLRKMQGQASQGWGTTLESTGAL